MVSRSVIEIQVQGDDPQVFAELVASTLYGHPVAEPDPTLACTGQLVREQQEEAERNRPSRNAMETVDFARLEPDEDWTDV